VASAFDWSPGGCCCGPKGWYDFYTGITQEKYSRLSSVQQIIAPINSLDGNGWFVQPGIAPRADWNGFAADDTAVWTFTSQGLACVNGVTKTLRFDKTLQQLFGGNAPSVIGGTASQSATKIARTIKPNSGFTPAFVFEVDLSGNAVNFGGSAQNWGQTNPSPGSAGTSQYQLQFFPWLGWPKVAGVRRHALNTQPASLEIFIADVIPGTDHVELANIQPVKTIVVSGSSQYIEGRWASFDWYDGHWAGVIDYDTGISSNPNREIKHEFLIDGVVKESLTYNAATDPFGLRNPDNSGTYDVHRLGIPRVCQQSDTIAVFRSYIPENASGPHILRLYHQGNAIWDSPQIPGIVASVVFGTSDRWIYFRTPGTQPASFVNFISSGEFTATAGTNQFAVNYDGSQVIPLMKLSNTFGQFVPKTQLFPQPGPDVCVRDSANFEDTLPATYQEMYDRRNE
jgi:hypothetical protein